MKRILHVNYLRQYKLISAFTIAIIFILNGSDSHCQSFEWAKKIGGSGFDNVYGNAVDQSGNVYTAGIFMDTVDFDPSASSFNLISAGGIDIFILKLDASGNFIWAKKIGGTSYEDVFSLSLDISGNIHISGYFQETVDFDPSQNIVEYTSFGNEDIFILKLDTDGNFIWARQVGSESFEVGELITVDALGDVILSGSFTGTMDFDPGIGEFNLTSNFADLFILKLDVNGNFIWVKQITGTYYRKAFSIMSDLQRNIFVTGYFSEMADFDPSDQNFELTALNNNDIYILKLNSFGDFVWAKQMGGEQSDYGHAIDVSPSGEVYTTGNFRGTADFDPGEGVYNLTAVDSSDIFVTKLSENGDLIWAKKFGGTFEEVGFAIALDVMNNVYTTGSFSGEADFNPSENTFNLISQGQRDIFVSKLDSQENFVWAVIIGGLQFDAAYSISAIQEDQVIVTGSFMGTVDFNPNFGGFNLSSENSSPDVFILKLGTDQIGIVDLSAPQPPITIYPNPNNGDFTIQSKTSGAFAIVNQLGQKIKTFDLNISNQFSEKINGFSNGIYFVLGTNNNAEFRQKIIVAK